jgi:hypothetical protein
MVKNNQELIDQLTEKNNVGGDSSAGSINGEYIKQASSI